MKAKKRIMIVFGTRPELIRFASIIHNLLKNKNVELSLVHTGQHYSDDMNDIFFRELNIPKPDVNLGVGGLTPNEQMGKIIIGMNKTIDKLKPDLIAVWGDTNSSLGAAIAANKKMVKLCHVEAGCRSHDFRMAEEYNRILIDHLSDLLFPLSKHDHDNLRVGKVHGKSIFLGDPLYDVFLENQKKIKYIDLGKITGGERASILMTLHRAENVDSKNTLKNILEAVSKIKSHKNLFPIHPRTKKMIEKLELSAYLQNDNIVTVPPLGYFELLKALDACDFVITDSGGLQKEAFFAKKICITLRKSTEWTDTVKLKANILLDPESEEIKKLPKLCADFSKKKNIFASNKARPYGDGKATSKIVKVLIKEIK